MKGKRILSLICVLTLAMTLASSFTYAATPVTTEVEAGGNIRSPYYCYVKQNTYLYYSKSVSSQLMTALYSGEQLLILSSGHTASWRHVQLMDGSMTGYVLRAHIIEPG